MEGDIVNKEEPRIRKEERVLRTGHTTGTCAAAAAKAAVSMLLSQEHVDSIELMTPKGVLLNLSAEGCGFTTERASCAIRKDAGDDPDCTHGALICAEVGFACSGISIDGGEGVGRVTKNGLDQPIGSAAINSTPRRMIYEAVREVCAKHGYDGGISVTISVPGGEKIAENTFNPRLGIVGGISIIGTSGIVEPMSEKALIDTTRLEMKVRMAAGHEYLLIVPGNYGKEFVRNYPMLRDEDAIKCSNFIGEALDSAVGLGAKGILLVGNLGKMVKVAGGIMNTHSKYGDHRMDILASACAEAGIGMEEHDVLGCTQPCAFLAAMQVPEHVCPILGCNTTDDALDRIGEKRRRETMDVIIRRISSNMDKRVNGKIEVGAIVFSSKYGKLCSTENADVLAKKIGGIR